jgi:SAM-dependent methyltransferase
MYGRAYFHDARSGLDCESPWFHELSEIRFRRILSTLRRLCPGGRLLDVGCATGDFLVEARRAGYEAAGLEISDYAAGVAKERGLDVFPGGLGDFPAPQGSFDIVTMFHVLEHMEQPGEALRTHVKRLLRPGGILVVEVPNFASLRARLDGAEWEDLRPEQHRYHFTPRSLRNAAAVCGFRPLCLETREDEARTLSTALMCLPMPWRWIAGAKKLLGRSRNQPPPGYSLVTVPASRRLRDAAAAAVCLPLSFAYRQLGLARRLLLYAERV